MQSFTVTPAARLADIEARFRFDGRIFDTLTGRYLRPDEFRRAAAPAGEVLVTRKRDGRTHAVPAGDHWLVTRMLKPFRTPQVDGGVR